ncbi:MAG: zinc metallopeptidase RseP, partial [Gammaproteobacteria bacterium]
MIEFLQSIVSFIVAIGILVTIHEYGHFWVARKMGVKVLRFSVGFGKPIWLKKGKDGTEYVIAAIPLGGYVRMLGEQDEEI